jgi:hypothetical protein
MIADVCWGTRDETRRYITFVRYRRRSPSCAAMPNRKTGSPRASAGDETSWREELKVWKSAGVTHVTVNSAFERNHQLRIASRSLQAHLTALERYRDAIADLL